MSDTITTIPQHYQIAYTDAFRVALQQELHILAGTYEENSVMGDRVRFDYMGPALPMVPTTSRNSRTKARDMATFIRWAFPIPYTNDSLLDRFDKLALGSLGDPTGTIVTNHRDSANRTMDAIIANALVGTAMTGQTGVTPVTLPSSQIVAVNYVPTGAPAQSGLTLGKILKLKQLFDAAQVPTDGRYLAIGSQQEADLLANVDQVSNDRYVDVKALIDGKVMKFAGFEFKRNCDGFLPISSSSIRTVIAWHKKGVGMGTGQDLSTNIDILPERNRSILIDSCIVKGATRLEEGRVAIAYCDETL
jgi:hypothetical protein